MQDQLRATFWNIDGIGRHPPCLGSAGDDGRWGGGGTGQGNLGKCFCILSSQTEPFNN